MATDTTLITLPTPATAIAVTVTAPIATAAIAQVATHATTIAWSVPTWQTSSCVNLK